MDDLRITWLPGEVRRVGLTLTPGLPTRASDGTVVNRDLDADLVMVARDAARLVVLLTDAELEAAGATSIVERGLRTGLIVVRRPLPETKHPWPMWLMENIAAWRDHGPTVYSDGTGRGRAAIAAAWTLIADGSPVDEAVRVVRASRGSKALATASARARLTEFADGFSPPVNWGGVIPLPSAGLATAHLPPRRAPWFWSVSEFALTFDGYVYAGGIEPMSRLWRDQFAYFQRTGSLQAGLPLDLARACLFFIQRIFHDRNSDPTIGLDPGPTTDELVMGWALVEQIREVLGQPTMVNAGP